MPLPDEFERGVIKALPILKAVALKLTRNRETAEDLVQETALRAFVHRSSFEPGTNLDGWLTTILKNFWFTQCRKRAREVEDIDGVFANAIAVNDSALRHLEAKEVLRAVDGLPDIWRGPLRLVADGASIEEVAAELHEHDGTIKSRINRGREMLRRATGGAP